MSGEQVRSGTSSLPPQRVLQKLCAPWSSRIGAVSLSEKGRGRKCLEMRLVF